MLSFPPAFAFLPILIPGITYIAFVIWSEKKSDLLQKRLRLPWQLFVLLLLAMGIQYTALLLRYDRPARLLFNLVASDSINGFYRVSAEIPHLRDFLREYPWLMERLPNHLTTHPPGNVLLFWLTGKLTAILPGTNGLSATFYELGCMHPWVSQTRGAALLGGLAAFLYPIAALFAIFPLYFWTRNEYGSKTAWRAAALYPLVPAFVMNVGQTDQLYPLFAMLALYTLQRGLSAESPRWLFASGAVLSAATFLSLGLTAYLMPIGLVTLYSLHYVKSQSWQEMAKTIAWLVAGFLTVWLLYFVYTGTNPIFIWIEGLTAHTSIGRNYLPWLFFNLLDVGTFWGIPLLAIIIARFVVKGRAGVDWFITIVLLTFLVLNLTGMTRGEVSRLWLFLLPLYIILAVESLGHLEKTAKFFTFLLGCLLIQLVIYAALIDTPHPRIHELRTTTRAASTQLPAERVDVAYSDQLNLVGYETDTSLSEMPEQLNFDLFWQVRNRPDGHYSVFTHLLDADSEELIAQNDRQFPFSRDWPTSCWESERVYSQSFSIRPNSPLPDGGYIVASGFYNHTTNERLQIERGEQVADGSAVVARFRITEGKLEKDEDGGDSAENATPEATAIAQTTTALPTTATKLATLASTKTAAPSHTAAAATAPAATPIIPTEVVIAPIEPTQSPPTVPLTVEATKTILPSATPPPPATAEPTRTVVPIPTETPTPTPPPCIDPVQPPPGEYPLVGLHASADAQITGWERCLFQQVRPSLIKVLTHHPPEHIRLLARSQPQATWIIRVQFKFEGRNVDGAQFAEWALADTQRTVNALAGRPIIIELHNEPNTTLEGWQHQWSNGWEFSNWWLDALPTFRAAFPGVPIIYPGLSPGSTIDGVRQANTTFLNESAQAVAAADGLGVHIYWAQGYSMDAALAVLDDYIAAYPDKPIWITETSNNKGGITDEERAAQYLQLIERVGQRPSVRGVVFFVASASDPQFADETWLDKGIGAIIGAR